MTKIKSQTLLNHLLNRSFVLDPIGEQERLLLDVALHRCSCPVCGQASNQVEACQEPVYDLGDGGNTFACPSCKEPLELLVPFMASTPWLWQRRPTRSGR